MKAKKPPLNENRCCAFEKKRWPWKNWKTRKKYLKKFTNEDSRQIPLVKTKSMPVNKYKKCAYDETAKLPTKKPHKFWKTEFVTQTLIESLRPVCPKWRIFITPSDLFDQYLMSIWCVFDEYLISILRVFGPAKVPAPADLILTGIIRYSMIILWLPSWSV